MMLNFLQVQRLTYMYYATIGYKTLYGSYLATQSNIINLYNFWFVLMLVCF